MQDAVWTSACCAPNNKGEAFSCVRASALKWACLPNAFVSTTSYSATVPKARLPLQKKNELKTMVVQKPGCNVFVDELESTA